MTLLLLVAAGAFAISLALTLAMERSARTLGLLQNPNARSSHSMPTPGSGGLGIAAAGIAACLLLAPFGGVGSVLLAALCGAMAALGLVDDRRDLSPLLRFPLQAVVVIGLILLDPGLPALTLPGGVAIGGTMLVILMAIAGLWWINLFNFMDGIDGIAASQAILILLGAAALWVVQAGGIPADWHFVLTVTVAAAALGFLLRNWPPAHIFMGDIGSNFLAAMIFAVALATLASGAITFFSWLALIMPFAVDASVTLLRRLVHGERPWQAHRRHGYQQLSRRWGHQRTTLLYGALSLFWALPLALAAALQPDFGWLISLVAAVPLVALALWSGAGDRAERPVPPAPSVDKQDRDAR